MVSLLLESNKLTLKILSILSAIYHVTVKDTRIIYCKGKTPQNSIFFRSFYNKTCEVRKQEVPREPDRKPASAALGISHYFNNQYKRYGHDMNIGDRSVSAKKS